ncbi:MAG: transcriptional regulator, TetR family [Polaromonas sp.]|jgi:TetR/AcrR family transcriptional regulator of autoinduction and epiphytic fitness|nr:transcriptional regulator, TetR family [Polaromonas sp.]
MPTSSASSSVFSPSTSTPDLAAQPEALALTPEALAPDATVQKPALRSALKAGHGVTAKVSFKAQMLKAREDAIVQAVNRLLAEKGFDLMTVDEVAAEVGIAKASLYKHFSSKEDLAAAAMVRVLGRALAFLASLPADGRPLDQLRALTRWMMQLQLAGEMPSLPSQNSTLRSNLMNNAAYLDGLMQVSDRMGAWIEAAQQDGSLSAKVPPLVVMYTLYSRACDPVLEFLKASGLYNDDDIVELVMGTCFDGLNTRQGH